MHPDDEHDSPTPDGDSAPRDDHRVVAVCTGAACGDAGHRALALIRPVVAAGSRGVLVRTDCLRGPGSCPLLPARRPAMTLTLADARLRAIGPPEALDGTRAATLARVRAWLDAGNP